MIYAVVRFVYDFLSGAGRAQTAPSCNEVTVTLKVTVTCINNRQAAARQPKPLTQKRLAEGCPAGCLHPPAFVLMPLRAFYDLELPRWQVHRYPRQQVLMPSRAFYDLEQLGIG